MFDESVIHKCKADAIKNTIKITQANTIPNTTVAVVIDSGISTIYKIIFGIFIFIIALLITYIVYTKFISNIQT